MITFIPTDQWLRGIATIGLVVYIAWTGFVVTADKPLDYYVYVIAAHAFGNAANIYTAAGDPYSAIAQELGITNYTAPYQYPILTALVVYPLTLLPLRVGAVLWIGLSGLAALAAGFILCSWTTVLWKKRLIVAAVVFFVPIFTTMYNGQVNVFVLLATVLALSSLHRGRDTVGGVMLAVGLWLKPFAIALIPLLLWHRKWQCLGGVVVGSLLINLMSGTIFGLQPLLSQFTPIVNVTSPSGLMVIPTVQNLNGFVGRLTIGLPSSMGFFLYGAVAGVLASTTMGVLWLNRHRKTLDIESVLLIVTTHLIVPLTWYHHLAMIVLAFAFSVIYSDNKFQWNAMVLIILLGFILTNIHGLAWKQLADLHPALTNFPTLTALFLWGLTLKKVAHNPMRDLP